ncbi:uncharacterized protein UDID_12079 [Ustilago sp. UG-2017a]|nr:uncharacterized protein UDID_12079 [Ustilago sp. UG-2017a]
MVSRRTRIVALLLLLAIHAVGVVSALGFHFRGRSEWPEGHVLTDKGYIVSTIPEAERSTALGDAARSKAHALYFHGITYTLKDNKVKLRQREFSKALKLAKEDGGSYVGSKGQDRYFYSIIKPETELGKSLGLRPSSGTPTYASVLWKHTNGNEPSIVGVTKFETSHKMNWVMEPFEEVLKRVPK